MPAVGGLRTSVRGRYLVARTATGRVLNVLPHDREWSPAPGASDVSLARLVATSAVELPTEYLAFLSWSNGGEGPLAVQPFYLQIDAAEEASLSLEVRRHDDFPGFLIFGSNGAGEFVAFDVRGSSPWPIVALDMTNTDLSDSVLAIAPSFAALLDHVGKQS